MKHDHRQSMWVIAGGHILWCYQCGAWKLTENSRERTRWHKPTGIGGPNPAVAELNREQP
jgi:hypothetical protein